MFKFEKDDKGNKHWSFDGDSLFSICLWVLIIYMVIADIPKIQEQGLKGVVSEFWCGQDPDC